MNLILFDFVSIIAIISRILVITARNPVISILFLISTFVNVACYLLLLGIGYIGLSYLIVYVGRIRILFLFVVMLLNLQLAEIQSVGSAFTQNIPIGVIISFLFIFEIMNRLSSNISILGIINWFNINIFNNYLNNRIIDSNNIINNSYIYFNYSPVITTNEQIQSIGYLLYTINRFWLILTRIILLIAIVGPISLSINKNLPRGSLF